MLFTQFCGFKVMVMANRLGCNNVLARCAHDRLLAKIDQILKLMREALEAQRCLMLDKASDRYSLSSCDSSADRIDRRTLLTVDAAARWSKMADSSAAHSSVRETTDRPAGFSPGLPKPNQLPRP